MRKGLLMGAALLMLLAGMGVRADGPVLGDEVRADWAVAPMAATGADDTDLLQDALTRLAANGGGVLELEGRPYLISRPLVIPPRDNSGACIITIRGQGVYHSAIIKTTNTAATLPKRKMRSNAVEDDMAVDAIIVIDHPNNSFAYLVNLEHLSLHGASREPVKFGIYAPRLARSTFRDVSIEFTRYGIYGYQWFLCQMDQVYLSGMGRADDGVGFSLADDGTGRGGSTTVTQRGTFVQNYGVGYRVFGLHYSAWENCAADNIGTAAKPGTAYWFEYCRGLVLSGAGTERNIGRTLKVVGGAVDVRGFYSSNHQGANADVGTVELSGCMASFSACLWTELGGERTQKDIRYGVAAGQSARVTWISSQLPNGGAGITGTAVVATLP